MSVEFLNLRHLRAFMEVADAHGRDLCVLDPEVRRTPVAGATPALADALLEARRTF